MKQVIIIRRDLKCRRGKEIVQGAHASMAFILHALKYNKGLFTGSMGDNEFVNWLSGGQTKVCLQIPSEEELFELHEKAKEAKLMSHYITDAGRTEFNGVPTITSLAIGPGPSEEIDKITGHLKLY